MLDSLLKYNFPKDSKDPYDINADENYFVFADAYSNLSRDLRAFSFSEFEKNIPMGYRTIVICHRILLIDKGEKIINWPFIDTHNLRTDIYSGKYFLTTNKQYTRYIPDWNRNIQTAVVYRPETTDGSLNSCIWNDFEICRGFALQNSLDTKSKQLISVVIDTISWH